MNVYDEALKQWGEEAQLKMAIEEMSELTKEICKAFRGKENPDKVREEIADVEIMLTQLKKIYGDVRMIKDAKLARLAKMLNKE